MPTLKLYVALSEHGRTKIGVSKNPQKRMLSLDRRPTLVHVEEVPPELNAYDVERLAHGLVWPFRHSSFEREWFKITPQQAIDAVKRALDMAKSDDCVIGWVVRLETSPTIKAALLNNADEDEIEVEALVSNILRDYLTARSTA